MAVLALIVMAVAQSRLQEEFVPDVTRRWRQSDASWSTPHRPVDLSLVADLKFSRCFFCDEYRVVHPAPRAAVLLFDLLPELDSAHLELGKFLFDLSAKTFLLGLIGTLATTWKHPELVSPSPNKEYPTTFGRHQL